MKKEDIYKGLLDDKEKLNFVYNVGLYTMLLTNNRVILKKGISHSLITFKYRDIEIAEYMTKIKWVFVILAAICFVASYIFWISLQAEGGVTMMNFKMQGGTVHATQTTPALNNYIFSLIGFAGFLFGMYFLFMFVLSLFGKIRIFLENTKKPLEIMCKYSDDIPKILNHIEKKK